MADGLPGLPPPGFTNSNSSASAGLPGLPPPGFSKSNSGYNPLSALGQFASGVVEGNAGLLALASDLNPFAMMVGQGSSIARDPEGNFTIKMPASEAVAALADKYLPEKDPQYRYSRTIGNFVGPGGAAKGLSKVVGATPKLASFLAKQGGRAAQTAATTGAIGAQAAEDVTGDKAVAPLIGAVFGSAGPSVFSNLARTTRSVFKGASPQEIRGSAAQALKELTGLSSGQIDEAIRNMPDDQLGALMTTAELTDNAGMAQIEKTLGAKPEFAQLYSSRGAARDAARENFIDSVTSIDGINKEGFGSKIIQRAGSVAEDMQNKADAIWRSVPRDFDINVLPQQAELADILTSRKGGLAPNSKVKTLADQFLNIKGGTVEESAVLQSGALQDIRSDALSLLRDANLTPFEQRILSQIQRGADEAMQLGLHGPAYERWIDAREYTKAKAETFGRGTAGGYLTSSHARPATAFKTVMKGDSKAVQDFKAAVAQDPLILEEAKRAFVDLIPRNKDGQITANSMKKFLSSNEGAINALLGKEHSGNLYRVLDDLRSEADVAQKGFAASKGGSVTAQKQSVADIIKTSVGEAATPGARGPFSSAINALMEAANIKNTEAIEDLLFKAALDPTMARMLADTATDQTVMSLIDRLIKTVKDGAIEGASRGGGLQLLRKWNEATGSANAGDLQSIRPVSPQGGESRSPVSSGVSAQERREPRTIRPASPSLSQRQLQGFGSQSIKSLPAVSQSNIPSPNSAQSYDETQALFNRISGGNMRNPTTPNETELILDAIRKVESSDGKYTTGPKTKYGVAKGSYQVLDDTGKEYRRKLGMKEPYDPYNEEQQREIVRAILEDYQRMFDGDIELALTAYHTGPGNVRKGKIGPQGKAYVPKIEKALDKITRQV